MPQQGEGDTVLSQCRKCITKKILAIKKEKVGQKPVWRSAESIEKRKEAKRKKARTPEGKAKRRERRKRARECPLQREKDRNDSRNYYRQNWKESNARKVRWQRENREAYNQMQRKRYQEQRVDILRKIKARRYERDPTRGLKTLLDAVKRGELGIDQALRRFREAVDRVCEPTSDTKD